MPAVRRAGPDDLDRIDAIEAASFTADRFARRNLARMLMRGRTLFFVSGEGSGYLALSLRRGSAIARIYSLAVHPDARGQGHAAALLKAARIEAMARSCRALRLQVRESNKAAQRLYEGDGFRLHKRLEGYYEDGETALQLEAVLDATDPQAAREKATL